MTFSPQTLSTLERFENADWFGRIGQDLLDEGKISSPVILLATWEDAIREGEKEEWDQVLNESANLFREEIFRKDRDKLALWNERVRGVKEISEPMVKRKLLAVQRENNLPASVEINLRWIVTMTFMEAEYSEIGPGNHSKLAFWIINGHVPCGWKGKFPNGDLIVF